MGLSIFLVFIASLCIAYYLGMRIYRLKNEEVAEKMDEVKEVDDLAKTINKVDINQTKRKKGKIEEFTKL